MTKDETLAGELAACKVINRDLDARVAVALYSDTGHADPRDNTRALLPVPGDECAPGAYWVRAFSGLSLRTAPGFTGDKLLRDIALAALSPPEAVGEAVERLRVLASGSGPHIGPYTDHAGFSLHGDLRRDLRAALASMPDDTALLREAQGHLKRLILAVIEFGPHSGFWDWADDAKSCLARIDAKLGRAG